MTNEHSWGRVPRRRNYDLETASRLWNRSKYEWDNVVSRPKAGEGSLLSLVKQRQHSLNQWSNAGVQRVAEQAKRAERKANIGIKPNSTLLKEIAQHRYIDNRKFGNIKYLIKP